MPASNDNFDNNAAPPHDESWWEKNLLQNEKLIDKYMDVLGDDPDWEKWSDPRDLYNKVHYGIEPGDPLPPGVEDADWDEDELASLDLEDIGDLDDDDDDDLDDEPWSTGSDEDEHPADVDATHSVSMSGVDPFAMDDDDEPRDLILGGENLTDEELAEYRLVSRKAMDFGVSVMRIDDLPEESTGLWVAAGKIAANLAGGHGLGYDEDTICGNIVKCRWALSECEFVIETLDFLAARMRRPEFATLLPQARQLRELIAARITKLRGHVWW
jgi:hypothetical protein